MTTLVAQYGRTILSNLRGDALDENDCLTDEVKDAINQLVDSLDKDEILELVWNYPAVDGDLLPGGIEDNSPQEMIRRIARACVRDHVMDVSGAFEHHRQLRHACS